MYESYVINHTDMPLAEALLVSERDKVSIVPSYYSDSAKDTVQYYINPDDKNFYCQNLDQRPRPYGISQERLTQRWEVYHGSHLQYHKSMEYKRLRFKELYKN